MVKSKHREKWSQRVPDQEATLLIENVVDLASERGITVDVGTIRYWQSAGILPLPLTRRIGGAHHCAIYPPCVVDALVRVRELQSRGWSIKQIIPAMSRWTPNTPFPDVNLFDALRALARYYQHLNDCTDIEKIRVSYIVPEGSEVTHRYVFHESNPGQEPVIVEEDTVA